MMRVKTSDVNIRTERIFMYKLIKYSSYLILIPSIIVIIVSMFIFFIGHCIWNWADEKIEYETDADDFKHFGLFIEPETISESRQE